MERKPYGSNTIERGFTPTVTQDDIALFQLIHDLGDLPTDYLFAFDPRKDRTHFSKHLKDLRRAGYLVLHGNQKEALFAHCNQHVHGLRPKTLDLIDPTYPVTMGKTWKHDTLVHCVMAMVALKCKELGYEFIPQPEILSKKLGTMKMGKVLDTTLIPDGVFAIKYPEGYRLFFLEVDRGTERLRTKSAGIKSFQRNVRQYRKFIGKGMYKDILGVNASAKLLVVTGGVERMNSMLKIIEEECPSGANSYMWVKSNPYFLDDGFRPPKLMPDITDDPWYRANHTPVLITD